MVPPTKILVPIRYPLTDESAQTLAVAGRLAQEHTPAELVVLHVNLYQNRDKTKTREITRAISSTLDDVEASVVTRHGFLVEEEILAEATQMDADIVVVGANQQGTWRRRLGKLLKREPSIGVYLRENLTAGTEVREVTTASETPVVEAV